MSEPERTRLSDGSVPVRQLKTDTTLYVQFGPPEEALDASFASQNGHAPRAGDNE